MAENKTQLLTRSLAEYKKAIKELQASMLSMDKTSKEYADTQEEIIGMQEKLTEVTLATDARNRGAADSYNGLSLQLRMLKDEWKKMARTIKDENGIEQVNPEWEKMAAKINETQGKLKEYDAEVGVFSRNVGNYADGVAQGLSQVGINLNSISPLFQGIVNTMATGGQNLVDKTNEIAKGMAGVSGETNKVGGNSTKMSVSFKAAFTNMGAAIKNVGVALKGLAANPVGAVIMALVVSVKLLTGLFSKMKESVARNETAHRNMQKALVPLKALMQTLTNIFDGFVEVLTYVAAGYGKVITKVSEFLHINNKQLEQQEEMADREQKLADKKVENIYKNADAEKEAAELREKYMDSENYTIEERQKALEKYRKTNDEINKRNLEEAKQAYELEKQRYDAGKSNQKDAEKLAELYANMQKAEQKAAEDRTRAIKDAKRLNREAAVELKAQEEAAKKAAEEQKQRAKEWADKIKEIKQQYKELGELLDEFFISGVAQQTKEIQKWYETQREILDKALKNRVITEQQYNNTYLRLLDVRMKKENAVYDAFFRKEYEVYEKIGELYETDYQKAVKANDKKYTELELSLLNIQAEYKKMFKEGLISYGDFKAIKDKINAQLGIIYKEAKEQQLKAFRDINSGLLNDLLTNINKAADDYDKNEQNKRNQLFDGLFNMFGTLSVMGEQFSDIGDGISEVWNSVFDNINGGLQQMAINLEDGKMSWSEWGKMASIAVGGASDILNTLAKSQDKTTKSGFKKYKALSIASATMSMAQGIISAMVESIKGLGVPAGPIVGAALSSTIAAMAGVNIANIKKQQFDENGGGSSTTPSLQFATMPSIDKAFDSNRFNTNSLLDINKSITNQRVYLVESDLANSNRRVSIRESNSRF